MTEKKQYNNYYPQSLLLFYASENPPKEAKKGDKVSGLVQSKMGIQKHVPLAKLKGDYIPEAVLSKVLSQKTGRDVDKYFMSLENHKLSSLTPEIRIYRRAKDNTILPFYFPVIADFEFLGKKVNLEKTFSSNSAVIENFSVTYTGKNPYAADRKFLEASLTVKLDNISTLFHEPAQSIGQYAPLADLFTIRVQGGSKKTSSSGKSTPANALDSGSGTNIIVTLGYANHQTDVLSSREMQMIEQNRMIISLYYSAHDLSMQQDGSATLSVKYTGFLETAGTDIMMDFITPKESVSKIMRDKLEQEKEKKIKSIKVPSKGKNDEQIAKAKAVKEEEVQKVTTKLIVDRFRQVFDSLFVNKKIHTIQYKQGYSLNKLEADPNKKGPNHGKIIPGSPAVKLYEFGEYAIDAKNPWTFLLPYRVHYVTFGDFLDSYFKILGDGLTDVLAYTKKVLDREENKKIKDSINVHAEEIGKAREKLKKMTVLMCDFKYAIKTENTSKKIEKTTNIADIPIAIDTLYTIIYDDMISTRKFWMDLNSFMSNLVQKILNKSFGELPSADFLMDVDFVVTNFVGNPCLSKIKKGVLNLRDLPRPIGDTSKEAMKKATEYFVIHQKAPSWTKSVGSGNKKADLDKGIFHLRASQDRGLVKSISFSKISQPARETYMIFRNGQMYDELRFPHNATVEMFGNNLFMPMSLVYINPDTLGFGDPRGEDSIARRLGFGGYYVAERVTTTYSAGQLNTSVQLHFNAFPELPGQSNLSETIKRSIKEL